MQVHIFSHVTEHSVIGRLSNLPIPPLDLEKASVGSCGMALPLWEEKVLLLWVDAAQTEHKGSQAEHIGL